MLAVYLPWYRQNPTHPFLQDGRWQVLFPKRYWEWYEHNPGVHPNDHRTKR